MTSSIMSLSKSSFILFYFLFLDFNGQCLCWMVLFSLVILCFDVCVVICNDHFLKFVL
jgi:hypothetical protein